MAQETRPGQLPYSEEEWAQTPPTVQDFLLSLIERVKKLETEIADLRERVKRNSKNSSKPPSSDGPEVPQKRSRRGRRKGKREGQPGHKGSNRKLMPIEQVKEMHDIRPEVCRRCGHGLEGEDPDPYRHQITEIPPVVAEVIEYRMHTWPCSECGCETGADIPLGVPKGAFGPRLQAMVSLLTGRYRLSKRDTAEVMGDFFQADLSLGSVSSLEQRTSEAIGDPVEEARK